MLDSTYTHGTSGAVSCKQCENNPVASEPTQDNSMDVTMRLSLRPPAANVKASPAKKLRQRGEGMRHHWKGSDQWWDQCGHRLLTTPS